MADPDAGEWALMLSTALTAALVERDPELADGIIRFLRERGGAARSEQDRRIVQLSIDLVELARARGAGLPPRPDPVP